MAYCSFRFRGLHIRDYCLFTCNHRHMSQARMNQYIRTLDPFQNLAR
jgi:hypothetical protein